MVAGTTWDKVKKRLPPHPPNPMLDNVLTLLFLAELFTVIYSIYNDRSELLLEFFGYGILTSIMAAPARSLWKTIALTIGTEKNLAQKRNARKFGEQGWRLTIHTAMTLGEIYLLSRPQVNWSWWSDIAGKNSTWEPIDQSLVDSQLTSFYMLQLGLWCQCGLNHRFYDSRHKDYFVMSAHHVATVGLVLISWLSGALRVGLLVLLIHDSQDIFADLVKMFNYLGYDGKECFFATELMFVTNLITWFYARLYLFPDLVIRSCFNDMPSMFAHPASPHESWIGHTDPNFTTLLWTCVYLLCAVCAMSAWWFVLFCKLLLKLATKTAEEVTAEEYTVDTEDEDDADAAAAASTSEADKVK